MSPARRDVSQATTLPGALVRAQPDRFLKSSRIIPCVTLALQEAQFNQVFCVFTGPYLAWARIRMGSRQARNVPVNDLSLSACCQVLDATNPYPPAWRVPIYLAIETNRIIQWRILESGSQICQLESNVHRLRLSASFSQRRLRHEGS